MDQTLNAKGIGHRIGVGIGCILGAGIIALVLMWVLVQIIDLLNRVTA